MQERRARDLIDAFGQELDADAVVRHRAGGIKLARDAVGQAAAEAEPDDTDGAVDLGASAHPRERGIDIPHSGVRIELPDEIERPRHVVVVLQVDVALDTPEQVRHDGHVTELVETVRHVAHVPGDAARLVEQYDAGAHAAGGNHEVGVELVAVVRGDPDRIRRHKGAS